MKYLIFHNYGDYEGWKIADCGELADLESALRARETELRSMGGGEVILVQLIDPVDLALKGANRGGFSPTVNERSEP